MVNPLHLNCPHCGGTLQAKDSSDHGKEVRCPRCQTVFRVELLDRSESTNSPQTRAAGSAIPRRRQSNWLVLVLSILVVGVTGSVAALLYYSSGKPPAGTIDLTYLPEETDVVAQLKFGELLNSPLLADVMGNPASQGLLTLLSTQTGISPRQIVSVTVGVVVTRSGVAMSPLSSSFPGMMPRLPGMLPPRAPYAVIVVHSSVAFDAENIAVKTLKGIRFSHAGQTYFKFPLPAGQGFDSCYFPEPDVAVIALEEDLKAVIDQGKKPVKIAAFDFVRTDQTFIVAATSDAFDISPLSPLVTTGANLQSLEKELKQTFRSGSFGLTVTNELNAEVILNCRDVAGATKVKSAVDLNVTDLKALLARQQSWLTLSGMTEVGKLGTDILDSITATQTDEKLQVVATVPENLKAIAKKYASGFGPFLPVMPGSPPGGLWRGFPGIPGSIPVPAAPTNP